MAVHENWHCKHLISQFNLQRGEGANIIIISLNNWNYTDFCTIPSYLVIFDSESFLFSLFLIHPDALTIFQGWLPNNYHCLICRPCLHELCLGITEKISDCLLCTGQMIKTSSFHGVNCSKNLSLLCCKNILSKTSKIAHQYLTA